MNGASSSELSMARRIGLGLVGAAGLVMATAITSLWLTEPTTLPAVTEIAFAAMVAVGIAWTVYAVWALSVRLPMFGRDRVVAWMIATVASVVSMVIVVAVGVDRGWSLPVAAALTVSTCEFCVAGWLFLRNVQRHRALLARRSELEAELQRE